MLQVILGMVTDVIVLFVVLVSWRQTTRELQDCKAGIEDLKTSTHDSKDSRTMWD